MSLLNIRFISSPNELLRITSWRSNDATRTVRSRFCCSEFVERQWYQYFLHNRRPNSRRSFADAGRAES
jgi:hypothetical protein